MILAHGILYEDDQLETLRSQLEQDCITTISGHSIDAELVIAACDALAERIRSGQYDHILKPFLTTFHIDPGQFRLLCISLPGRVWSESCALSWAKILPIPLCPTRAMPLSGGSGIHWASCSTSPRAMWTVCPLTVSSRDCW